MDKPTKEILPLVEVDSKHQCPVGVYARNCDSLEGDCLKCGLTVQRDADLLVVQPLQARLEKAEAENKALQRASIGEVWYWQGDGYDFPESLACPVLIEPETIRDILAELAEAQKMMLTDAEIGQLIGKLIGTIRMSMNEWDSYDKEAILAKLQAQSHTSQEGEKSDAVSPKFEG